jgi:hypothetical protein
VISINYPCMPCTVFGYTVPVCHGRWDCVRDDKIIQALGLEKES